MPVLFGSDSYESLSLELKCYMPDDRSSNLQPIAMKTIEEELMDS